MSNSLRTIRGIDAVMADAASLRLMVEAVRWTSLSATAAAVAAAAATGQGPPPAAAGGGGHQTVQQPPGSISAPVSMHFDVDPDEIIMNGETVRLVLARCGVV